MQTVRLKFSDLRKFAKAAGIKAPKLGKFLQVLKAWMDDPSSTQATGSRLLLAMVPANKPKAWADRIDIVINGDDPTGPIFGDDPRRSYAETWKPPITPDPPAINTETLELRCLRFQDIAAWIEVKMRQRPPEILSATWEDTCKWLKADPKMKGLAAEDTSIIFAVIKGFIHAV